MPLLPSACVALLLLCPLSVVRAGEASALPRSAPEEQGMSSEGIRGFIEALDQVDAMHGLVVVRHGQVVAEGWWAPYDAASPHELYSLSKSFTSTAVGLAVSEGKISIDDPVLKFFPDDAPAEPSGNLRAMRIRDLLSMSTGHQDEPPTSPDKVSPRSFLAQPVPHKPGTHFKYNTAATFMLSAIVQKVTGQTVFDYLTPRLFEPLGIEGASWATNFQGVCLGGYGLKVRTEDIAKFGQLYLQNGKWQGTQLIPSSWVEAATRKQTSNGSNPASDWDQGYGYQFWRCRNDAYRGDGAFGQYCVVLPKLDMVVAINSGVRDMQAVLNVIWDRLLPAVKDGPVPEDSGATKRLRDTLAGLTVRFPEGAPSSPRLAKIAGKTFLFPENAQGLGSMRIERGGDGKSVVLLAQKGGAEKHWTAGIGEWIKGRGDFGSGLTGNYSDEPLAASAAWSDDETLVFKVCAVETPFYATFRLRFDGNRVTFERQQNVGFGSTGQPTLVGVAQ